MAAQQSQATQEIQGSTDQLSQPEQSLKDLFGAVYSQGNLSFTGQVIATDARVYCAGVEETYQGVSGLKAHAVRLRTSFPGLSIEVDEVYRINSGFVAELRASGRFERAFGGIQPSCGQGILGEEPGGPEVEVACRAYGMMADGMISNLAFDWDIEALRAQG